MAELASGAIWPSWDNQPSLRLTAGGDPRPPATATDRAIPNGKILSFKLKLFSASIEALFRFKLKRLFASIEMVLASIEAGLGSIEAFLAST